MTSPEKRREYTKRYRAKNRGSFNAYRRRYNATETGKHNRRNTYYKSKYGITHEEFDALVAKQNGLCAICGILPVDRLQVDHEHKTRKVRGLLCWPCNVMIGIARDNPKILEMAKEYLNAQA